MNFKAVDSIEPLLIRALEIIPTAYHKITRISLKATAGLRLISDEIANQILNNVNLNEFFKSSKIIFNFF